MKLKRMENSNKPYYTRSSLTLSRAPWMSHCGKEDIPQFISKGQKSWRRTKKPSNARFYFSISAIHFQKIANLNLEKPVLIYSKCTQLLEVKIVYCHEVFSPLTVYSKSYSLACSYVIFFNDSKQLISEFNNLFATLQWYL